MLDIQQRASPLEGIPPASDELGGIGRSITGVPLSHEGAGQADGVLLGVLFCGLVLSDGVSPYGIKLNGQVRALQWDLHGACMQEQSGI